MSDSSGFDHSDLSDMNSDGEWTTYGQFLARAAILMLLTSALTALAVWHDAWAPLWAFGAALSALFFMLWCTLYVLQEMSWGHSHDQEKLL